ncbi:hypothetical protein ACRS52_06495 [Bacillus cytotoxicus]|uniref:hypothetical protein n=1 Tax=Bacillus cytotoxicus TaxID=580165 RepID=UPI001AEE8A51|nr:hypothetical protein [Bacillus cytotoxicus]QTR81204.1 hypothetical protein JC777_00780 [Bacillus cytotoxicus]
MKIALAAIPVPVFIKTPFELGDWVAFECEDYTTFARVKCLDIDSKTGRIKVYGVWGNTNVMNAGDKGWQYADQCRLATENEQYWEERRRVFASKNRRNNEFHSGDYVSDDVNASVVLHQDKETGKVSIMIINSGKRYEVDPDELEILFFNEDRAG